MAELCGFNIEHEDEREVLVDKYLAELKKCLEEQEETDKEFHLYNDQIVWEDHENTGDVYVPKRCIDDDDQDGGGLGSPVYEPAYAGSPA